MERIITYSALGLGLALVAFIAWYERRPRTSLAPRLLPTTPLLFVGMLVAVLAFVHLLNLNGIRTGR